MRNELKKRFPNRDAGFSLIELLLVIAVIAILSTLVGLSISGLGQSNKLSAAGNMTVDVINAVRQSARSENTMAMMAVISNGPESGRVMTTMIYSRETASWRQADKWMTLPEGIKINMSASTNLLKPVGSTVSLPTRGGTSTTCEAAVFLPDGRLMNSSTTAQVLSLSTVNGSGDNNYQIIVNQATGVPIVRRP